MISIESYRDAYFVNGVPVPYTLKKGGTIMINPIKVKDYSIYDMVKAILLLNKNETNDISIIQMSYLDYLIEVVFPQSKEFGQQFIMLFNLCLGIDKLYFEKDKGKNVLVLVEKDDEGNETVSKVINRKEFDEIRNIILNQNDPNYDDRYVNPEVRELMIQYQKAKNQNVHYPSFEERKSYVCSKIGKTYSELNEMTCREFDLIYDHCVNSEIYLAQKIIQASFKYEVKEDIKHPLFENKRDPYAEIFTDTSALSNKGITGAEALNSLNL